MKAFLMHRDRDFDLQQRLPWNEPAMVQDLELNTLFNAMALGDKFLFEVAKTAILSSLSNSDAILYRQDILKDCLKNSDIVKNLYTIPVEAMETKKKNYWSWGVSSNPSYILHSSVEILQMFADRLRQLRNIADEHADKFESEGFTALFTMLKKELNDEYLASIESHLKELKFRRGVLVSAELGKGNEGSNYILRKPRDKKQSLMERAFAQKSPVYTFRIDPRDIGGGQALSELNNRAINLVANAVAQSADHINSFFSMLRVELAFYIGCLNLYAQLAQMGEPVSFPLPAPANERRHSFNGLYDICLALTMKQKIVGNKVNADNKDLVLITGANQGVSPLFCEVSAWPN